MRCPEGMTEDAYEMWMNNQVLSGLRVHPLLRERHQQVGQWCVVTVCVWVSIYEHQSHHSNEKGYSYCLWYEQALMYAIVKKTFTNNY